jgi:subtilisin family serine protease
LNSNNTAVACLQLQRLPTKLPPCPYTCRYTCQAGTIAGSTYGVAKQAIVIPVRVLDNSGSGSTESLVAGLNYVISDTREQCKKKVVNLSLGLTTRVDSVDRAVQAAYRAGILVVVAAGNDGVDACNASPAASPLALTVGATGKPTGSGRSMRETRATFSNYGRWVLHHKQPPAAVLCSV